MCSRSSVGLMRYTTNLVILPLLWAYSCEYARPVQRMSRMSSDALLRIGADSTCKVLAVTTRVIEHDAVWNLLFLVRLRMRAVSCTSPYTPVSYPTLSTSEVQVQVFSSSRKVYQPGSTLISMLRDSVTGCALRLLHNYI